VYVAWIPTYLYMYQCFVTSSPGFGCTQTCANIFFKRFFTQKKGSLKKTLKTFFTIFFYWKKKAIA